jgi:hypothetical protein
MRHRASDVQFKLGRWLRAALLLLALMQVSPGWPHSGSNTFIELRESETGLVMRVDVPLRDLAMAMDLDLNRDAEITWGELKQQQTIIEDWLLDRKSVV